MSSRERSRGASGCAVALVLVLAARTPVAAQVPGLPVLQNAFVNRGLSFAGNFGGGGGQSYYGVAAGWGLGGRLAVSGGAGAQRMGTTTRGAYGGRAVVSLWSNASGSFGAGAFAGLGGAPRTRANGVVTSAAVLTVPVGASVSYRRAFGSHGVSVYASPIFQWTRADAGTGWTSGSTFAGSAGLDFGVSSTIGATIGTEFGQSTIVTPAGRSTGSIGIAVSFVPGGR